MIKKEDILEIQTKWASGIVEIGTHKDDLVKSKSLASDFLDQFYSFEYGIVLFKPTKCSDSQFRPTKEMALSYFVAGENAICKEDKGFAINPWVNVRFENSNIILDEDKAFAMGNYFFTDENDSIVKVEYTFGYKLFEGELKIFLHHSSLPYKHA